MVNINVVSQEILWQKNHKGIASLFSCVCIDGILLVCFAQLIYLMLVSRFKFLCCVDTSWGSKIRRVNSVRYSQSINKISYVLVLHSTIINVVDFGSALGKDVGSCFDASTLAAAFSRFSPISLRVSGYFDYKFLHMHIFTQQ